MTNIIQRSDLDMTGRLSRAHHETLTMRHLLELFKCSRAQDQRREAPNGFEPLDKEWLDRAQLLIVPAKPFQGLESDKGDPHLKDWMEVFFLDAKRAIIYPNEKDDSQPRILLYARWPDTPPHGPLRVVSAEIEAVSDHGLEWWGLFGKVLHCAKNDEGKCLSQHQGYTCYRRRGIGPGPTTGCACSCGNS